MPMRTYERHQSGKEKIPNVHISDESIFGLFYPFLMLI